MKPTKPPPREAARNPRRSPRVLYPQDSPSFIDTEDWMNGPVDGSFAGAISQFRRALQGRSHREVVKLWAQIDGALWRYARKLENRVWTAARKAAYGVKAARTPFVPGWSDARFLCHLEKKHSKGAVEIRDLVTQYTLPTLLAIIGLHEAYAGWGEGVTEAGLRLRRAQQIAGGKTGGSSKRKTALKRKSDAAEVETRLRVSRGKGTTSIIAKKLGISDRQARRLKKTDTE